MRTTKMRLTDGNGSSPAWSVSLGPWTKNHCLIKLQLCSTSSCRPLKFPQPPETEDVFRPRGADKSFSAGSLTWSPSRKSMTRLNSTLETGIEETRGDHPTRPPWRR